MIFALWRTTVSAGKYCLERVSQKSTSSQRSRGASSSSAIEPPAKRRHLLGGFVTCPCGLIFQLEDDAPQRATIAAAKAHVEESWTDIL